MLVARCTKRRGERRNAAVAEVEQPMLQDGGIDSVRKAGKIDIAASFNGIIGAVLPPVIVTGAVNSSPLGLNSYPPKIGRSNSGGFSTLVMETVTSYGHAPAGNTMETSSTLVMPFITN